MYVYESYIHLNKYFVPQSNIEVPLVEIETVFFNNTIYILNDILFFLLTHPPAFKLILSLYVLGLFKYDHLYLGIYSLRREKKKSAK